MTSRSEHLRGLLVQMLESHDILRDPGNSEDLEIVKRELVRINGFMKVLLKKGGEIQSSEFRSARAKFERYLGNYYFEQEIDTMSTLYSGDVGRIRSMRLKILEALNEHKMIDDARRLVDTL
ncbi:MAG: hypothetical protein D9C04_02620 [Nitrosopumilus sp. B06]|nr:MAG: hypothetical protein EB828_02280 [Nitrosopumilus sp. D6]RNJ80149.1 MAG: hypothetical protein D9C04_02620 [Nitrosopumilus sp. B06]